MNFRKETGMFIDIYYIILVVPAIIISMIAQAKVSSTFRKYSQVHSVRKLTGQFAAEDILRSNGVYDVSVVPIGGNLTDHFDPRSKKIGLSQPVYDSTSVAAIGVAAHESGHALQYAQGYLPIKLRNMVLPIAQFGSNAAVPLAILGLIFGIEILVNFGILLYTAIVLFQVVTLPVEFNASRRAIAILRTRGTLNDEELKGAKKVLTAAAMTYVAGMLTSLLSLLRLILLARNRD